MFTGIIEEVGKVTLVQPGKLVIAAGDILQGMELGASMSVNGVCLTITDMTDDSFSVDVMPETLQRSNIGLLAVGDKVNLERPLALDGRLGGHLVQGKVGDLVNLEVDIIAKYVEQLGQPRSTGITVDFLQENGFLVS